MSNLDDFASGLVNEVLSEMATNFFGARKRMDDHLEHFEKLVNELRSLQLQVEQLADNFHFLLGGIGRSKQFYTLLGVKQGEPGFEFAEGIAPRIERFPRAITQRGRFTRLVLDSYAALQKEADAFINGRHQPHPKQPNRIILSLNFRQLKKFCKEINKAIEKMSQEMPVSSAIRYAQSFANPAQADKERVTGAHCLLPLGKEGDTGLDASFAYQPIDFSAYGFREYCDLPSVDQAKPVIRAFCRELYANEKATVIKIMAAVKKAMLSSANS